MNSSIVIVGGGPVGLAFALAASRLTNIDVTVIERGSASVEKIPEPFDHRVYALSPGSLAFLREIGVELPLERMAPVRAMQVWGDDGKSELDFNAGQPLATIVEHAALMRALRRRLDEDGRVRLQYGVSPQAMQAGEGNRRGLQFADGTTLASELLIAADGSRSQIREWAGIATRTKDYDSDGVVANFQCDRGHGDVARQWFQRDSVLAFLPLPGKHVSIVWSVSKAFACALPADDPVALAAAVAEAGGQALGAMTLVSPVARFPLARIGAENWVQAGLALMGDAAHAVHPLAGQGVNLGFADARMMCEVLRERSKFSAVGDIALLRQYERARREAAWAVGEVTDRLRGLYLSDVAAVRWLRNDGMRLVNRMPTAKAMLIDYASR